MKFGLYTFAGTSGIFMRVIDGEAVTISNSVLSGVYTPSKAWEALRDAKGTPTANPRDPRWTLLTTSRPLARFTYGVPDYVDLYVQGETI